LIPKALLELIGGRDDADLVVRMRRRDPESIGMLYDRYGKAGYALALRVVGDVTWAECIVAESMLKCWNKVASFKETRRGAVGICLLLTIYANAMDHRRSIEARMVERQGKTSTLECEAILQNWSTHLDTDRVQETFLALRNLDAAEKTALDLAFFEGCNAAELSARLSCTSAELDLLIQSALKKLTVIKSD